jgi:hypothetical protein
MMTTLTIPNDVRTGALTLEDVPSCPGITADVVGEFRVAALLVYQVVRDPDGIDYVERARSCGEAIAVEAGDVVVVQVERTSDVREPAAGALRVRGAGWEGVDAEVVIGDVRTTAMAPRIGSPRGMVEVPVRVRVLGGECTQVRYELAEPVPGVAMVPQTIDAIAGVETLACLTFEVARAARGSSVRLLCTAFGGMQREILAPITLGVRARRIIARRGSSSSADRAMSGRGR